ncbi:MAG: DASH family cryptochrome [Bdellovibrionales bacterium]
MKSVYWVRRDLRILQNKTLLEFCQKSREAIFFFRKDPSLNQSGQFRRQYVESALFEFNELLQKKGQTLHVFENESLIEILDKIQEQFKFDSLYYSREFSIDEVNEEKQIENWCIEKGININSFYNSTLTSPEVWNQLNLGQAPQFTQFRKKIERSPLVCEKLVEPTLFPKIPSTQLNSLSITHTNFGHVHPSETTAHNRIQTYFFESKNVLKYKETRNGMIQFDDSTHFSPWLSLGIVSPESLYLELKRFESEVMANESTYWVVFELLWRDYFKFLSLNLGPLFFVEKGLTTQKNITTNNKTLQVFENWCQGRTGLDFIDANMIELSMTGWMSNRGRQNVASYLIHNLQVPWTWGAQFFEKMLIDYDPESNWGNWLYLSGRGTDPRSRVFNPDKQAQDYDSDSLFRKKWLKFRTEA